MQQHSSPSKDSTHAVDSKPAPKAGSKTTITLRVIGRKFVDGKLRITFDKGEAQGVKRNDKGFFSGRDGLIKFTIADSETNSWTLLDEKNLDAIKDFQYASLEIDAKQ
jgi:hypothetical protein